MVDLSKKGLILAGTDYPSKKTVIDFVRTRYGAGAPVDLSQWYPDTLDHTHLEDTLRMIGFHRKTLIIFRQAQQFKNSIKEIVRTCIDRNFLPDETFLIFDFETPDIPALSHDPFFEFLRQRFPLQRFEHDIGDEASFKGLYAALRNRRRTEALLSVKALLQNKEEENAPQIMGLLINFVQHTVLQHKDKAFTLFWETDRRIKTGLCVPRVAIPLLLVKLFQKRYL